MGKLVQFHKRSVERVADRPAEPRSAEIVIFTGVRYEREAPTMPTKPTASPNTKRKRG